MESKGITDLGTLPKAEQKQSAHSPGVILDRSHRFTQTEEASNTEAKTEAKTKTQQTKPISLESAVTKLNDYVQTVNRTLAFSIDEDSGQTVVRVFNRDTDELIRQIPAEHTLKLAAALEKHSTQGVLFEAKA